MLSFLAKGSNSPTTPVESRRPCCYLVTTIQPNSTRYSSAGTVARAAAKILSRYAGRGYFRAPAPISSPFDVRRNNRQNALRIRCAKPCGSTAPPSMTSFSKSANACGVQSEGEDTDEISIPVAELLRLVIKCQTNFQDYFMTGGMRCSRRIGLSKRLASYFLRLRQIRDIVARNHNLLRLRAGLPPHCSEQAG